MEKTGKPGDPLFHKGEYPTILLTIRPANSAAGMASAILITGCVTLKAIALPAASAGRFR